MKQIKKDRFLILAAAILATAPIFAPAGAAVVTGNGVASGCRASFDGGFFLHSLLKSGMREAGWPEKLIQKIMQSHAAELRSLFAPDGWKIQEDLGALSRVFGEEITAKAAQLYPHKDAFEAWRLLARSPSVSQYRSLIAARRGVALKGLDVLSQFTAKGAEAASHLQRRLTVIEGSFIWLAHQVGADRLSADRISADRISADRIAADGAAQGEPDQGRPVSGAQDKDPNYKPAAGDYTPGQLRRKSRILQEGGFSRQERGRLIRSGVTGTVEENVKQTALSFDVSVYVPDKTKTDPKGNARFSPLVSNNKGFSPLIGNNKDSRDHFSSMSYAENIRRFRANYDSAFDQILRRHVSFNFNGEPFIGFYETGPFKKLKGLFSPSRRKIWREPDSYEQAVAEDLLRAAFGKRPFRRITKHDILFPALKGPPIREIYTLAELKKQDALLKAAGYTEEEADHFYAFGVAPPLSLTQKILTEDFLLDDPETLQKLQTAQILFSIQDDFFSRSNRENGGSSSCASAGRVSMSCGLTGRALSGKPVRRKSVRRKSVSFNPEEGQIKEAGEESPSEEKDLLKFVRADPLSLNRIKEAVFADQPTVSRWEKDYSLSAPAAKDLWFQIIQELVTERYKRHSFDLTTNEGQKALAAWIEENTI